MFESYSFATLSASSVPCVSSNRRRFLVLVLIQCLKCPPQVVRGGAVGDRHLGGAAVPGHVQRTSAALRHGGRPPGQTRQLPRHAVSPPPLPPPPLSSPLFRSSTFMVHKLSPVWFYPRTSPFNFERGSIFGGGPGRSCGVDGEVGPEMSPRH